MRAEETKQFRVFRFKPGLIYTFSNHDSTPELNSQGIKRILAFSRLHEKHAGSRRCCCYFFVFVFTRFFIPEKSRNCPFVFDIAYQLLTHHSPFVPFCQVDE